MSLRIGEYGKSSFCGNGNSCVEIGVWSKASYCNSGDCVETSSDGYVVQVRDTKVSKVIGDTAPILVFGLSDWQDLISDERQHEYIVAAATGDAVFTRRLPSGAIFTQAPQNGNLRWTMSDQPEITLEFTPGEIMAWSDGVRNDEFDLAPELRELMVPA